MATVKRKRPKIIVGVNEFQSDNTEKIPIMRINEAIRIAQIEKIKILKATRDQNKVNACLKNIKDTASSSNNLMPSVIEAVEHHCTLGEIAGVLRAVFGEYQA